MNLTFRWYGDGDPVSLAHIRQIPGVTGVVSALYDVPAGEAWTPDAMLRLREEVEAAGLRLAVVESVPVHEDVKLGRPSRDRFIDAFGRSLEAVGAAGVGVVCYNFMPLFDWTRTELAHPLPDGSTTLAYRHADLARIEEALGTGGLPGWMQAYEPAELEVLRAAYADVGAERLWEHLAYFLERVVPMAEAAGVRLAIHPDDPPWSVFGLPRIITSIEALERVIGLVDRDANGVTLCTGSLGVRPGVAGALPAAARRLAEASRLHFVHLRNVRVRGDEAPCDFEEVAHPEGDVDLGAVVRALVETGYDGPVRPDHGRALWGELGAEGVRPGYGLYDRALGAAYLRGLWDAARHPA
jgi:mannonate dehydratase